MLMAALLTLSAGAKKHRGKRRRWDPEWAKQKWQNATNDFFTVPVTPVAPDSNEADKMPKGLNCDQAMDEILLQLPSFGSIFYALMNGWYLGQWADYASCMADATAGQYILATVKGDYSGPYKFTRGGSGKYTDGLETSMGLCFPQQCTKEEVMFYTHDLIKGYAEGVGFSNVELEYTMSSAYATQAMEEKASGTYGIVGIVLIGFGLMGIGSIIEMTTIGDKPELKEHAKELREAGKFRRLEQYDAVLL